MSAPITTYSIRHSALELHNAVLDLSAKAQATLMGHLDAVCAEYCRALVRTEWRTIAAVLGEWRTIEPSPGATEDVTHCTLIGGPPYLPHEVTLARVEFTRTFADGTATWSARAVRLIEPRPEWTAAKLGGG
jgi:hypothetical protein